MTKKLLLTFALLLTAVTGAWAEEYLYFEISGTSATMKYGENFWENPYYDERADWWINDSSWDGRENIKTITVDASCQNINQENLSGLFYEFTNLETITNIDKLNTANVQDMSRLFQGCSSLSTLDLSGWNTSEVTDMSSMFYGCTSLTTLNIIGWDTSNVTNTVSMFSGCTKLASISFPASLTTIGEGAFAGCSGLATVTVYAPSCTLGSNAFNGCGKLSNIYVFSDRVNYYQNATNWKDYAEIIKGITGGYCGTTDHEKDVVWVLTGESSNYTLTITGTGAMADYPGPSEQPWYSYVEDIETVIIEDDVTSIGNHAFESCTGLSSITLAEGLTTIGGYAFYNCGTIIESVTIPESVTSIGGNAFNGTNVTNFYINNIPSKIAIGETPFKADGVTIHVFTQMQSTFENATNWSAYTGHFNADIAISHVQSITLDNESMIMKTNTSGKLNATINPADARVKDVVFTSNNDNIIHITNAATGEFITGATEGNATITCTAMDGSGKYASCTVTVRNSFVPAESVTLNKSDMNIEIGNTNKLTATISPTNATYKNVTWRSSDENVATVDNTGYVTAIALGVATITAISHDGQARANCVVTVVASGSCGTGVTWTLTGTSPNYTLTITGTGAMADYDNYDDQPWYDYAENIKTIVIGNGVTSIGKNAFNGCYNLATVTFAAGSQLETIGESAFNGCSGLASITIPASLTGIGDGAFDGCSNLATVSFAAGSQLKTIGNYAFSLSGLASIEIPANVTSIGDGAFANCSGLATVTFAAGSLLETIGEGAFNGTGLASIEIPANVTSIGNSAFANTCLTSIEIPANVTSIGMNAFADCYNLATVTFAAGSQLETIGEGAFNGTGLASIEIPASVTTIGDFAFQGCTSLATVTFAAGSQLETIGESAFNGCSGLASITIPASLTTIGDFAFQGCTSLATVTVYAPSCTLGSSAFDGCSNDLKIYVFSDLVDDYQTAWSTYAGKITGIPTVTTSYVDADGTLHENVEAVPLNNAMTTLPTGTYVVNSDVTFSGNLFTNVSSSGEVNIILCDGATLTASNITPNGHRDDLRFYGQSQGTGTANISGDIEATQSLNIYGGTIIATNSIICRTGSVVIYGGNVTVAVIDGMYGSNFTGGTITVGEIDAGSDGPIILGGATVTADSYSAQKGVTIATGITYYDGKGHVYNAGNLSTDEITAIAGKTLRPVTGVTLTKDGSGNISAEFDGTSLGTVSIPINITVNSVTLNRTFTLHKCATLMLPFSLGDGQSLNGGTLYKFDGVNNGEGDWVATLSEFTSPLKANTPYLIQPNGHMTDDKITFDLNGGTVTLNTTTAGEDSNEKDDLWDFIGTYSYIKWTTVTGDQDYSAEREAEIGKVYGFAAVEKTGIHVGDFVRVASGAKIRPMCAYLKWKGSIPNNARALTRAATNDDTELPQHITVKLVSASGETTAIGTLDTTTGEVSFDSEAWYTLDGVRLSGKPTKKGLYINNGKKIVIR